MLEEPQSFLSLYTQQVRHPLLRAVGTQRANMMMLQFRNPKLQRKAYQLHTFYANNVIFGSFPTYPPVLLLLCFNSTVHGLNKKT